MAENEARIQIQQMFIKRVNIRLHLCSRLYRGLRLIWREKAGGQLMTLFWVRCEVEGDNEVAVSDWLEMDRTNT